MCFMYACDDFLCLECRFSVSSACEDEHQTDSQVSQKIASIKRLAFEVINGKKSEEQDTLRHISTNSTQQFPR